MLTSAKIRKQNGVTRTRKPEPGYLNLSNIYANLMGSIVYYSNIVYKSHDIKYSRGQLELRHKIAVNSILQRKHVLAFCR